MDRRARDHVKWLLSKALGDRENREQITGQVKGKYRKKLEDLKLKYTNKYDSREDYNVI